MVSVEIAPEEYHIICTYNEAILYCFTLEIDGKTGWRLSTLEEYNHTLIYGWYRNDESDEFHKRICMPVRYINE